MISPQKMHENCLIFDFHGSECWPVKNFEDFWKKFKKAIDKSIFLYYNEQALLRAHKRGGIAQLARAFGSYPECHWFKSNYSHQYMARWSRGLRHRPFTAVTRVRFPSGSPWKNLFCFRTKEVFSMISVSHETGDISPIWYHSSSDDIYLGIWMNGYYIILVKQVCHTAKAVYHIAQAIYHW